MKTNIKDNLANDNLFKEISSDLNNRNRFRDDYFNEFGIQPTEEELTEYIKNDFLETFGLDSLDDVPKKEIDDSPFSKVLGFVFVAWFVLSLIAMFYFSEKDARYTIMIFGQYFFVFGLLMVTKKIYFGFIFMFFGGCAVAIPLLQMHPEWLSFTINWEFLIVCGAGLVFFMVGFGFFLASYLSVKKYKNRCSTSISAQVVNVMNHNTCPIYQYEYNGRKIIVRGKSDKRNKLVNGDIVTLMINPKKPREAFFDEKPSTWILLFICLSPFMFAGLFIIYCAFTQML